MNSLAALPTPHLSRGQTMAGKRSRKPVKVGVREGGGPPPGYRWSVLILDIAHAEAREFLNEDQLAHLALQFKELASQDDPTHSELIDVRAEETYYKVRDKGGVLNRLNPRVFFFVHTTSRAIVVLGAMNKQNNGPTPIGVKAQIKRRMRLFLESQP